MILKQGEKYIRLAMRRKIIFIFDIRSGAGKAILVQERVKLTYFISKNPQIRL